MLSFCLLFLLCESTVKSWGSTWPSDYISLQGSTTATVTTEGKPSALQLQATPDYPVAAGQRVDLHCSALTKANYVTWAWDRLENQTWREVSHGQDLTLTEPQQSGLYRCRTESNSSQRNVSPDHMVYIISVHATVGEKLGIAAFALSLLSLIINLTILFWLGWQRLGDMLTTSSPAPKGVAEPQKSPKEGLPKTDSDGDVYMNYTSTNHAYTDLDPTNVAEDNVYSSLS
ncbi:uncharacterized protein LOC121618395 [Chelmon rostratus]|uniref:uncharacterized protein LOC121618395 n=1 Tax=Chelmon rostratus TaxID=109905 RepID=UPI001BEC31A4|nr:uncharacterized protein LOC121618395 [Chelmon rostratus]